MSELQIALAFALKHIAAPTTTEREREAILSSIATEFSGETGETASQSLHHLREQRRLQLTLKAIIEGIGGQPERDGDGDGNGKKDQGHSTGSGQGGTGT